MFSCNNTPDVSPSILWETCKAFSRGLIMSYEKSTKRKRQEEQRKVEIQLSGCERAYNQNPTDLILKQLWLQEQRLTHCSLWRQSTV